MYISYQYFSLWFRGKIYKMQEFYLELCLTVKN